ncbi:MAG: 1,4-alpha-glucan branching enzyme, partial [Mariprofundus sp.]|nr:1,4-alpha-glucan branching enzyme [Mariprofundus sp.]
MNKPILSPEAWAVVEARSHDPFGWLGMHEHPDGGVIVRALSGQAEKMWLLPESGRAQVMKRIEGTDIFEKHWKGGAFDKVYRFRIENHDGHRWEIDDVYNFGPVLGEMDLHLIGEGNHFEKYRIMGAHVREHEGVNG